MNLKVVPPSTFELPTGKSLNHSSGKLLDVYDDLFSNFERKNMYSFMKSSLFRADGYDAYAMPLEMQMYSSFSEDDLGNLGFMDKAPVRALRDKYGLDDMELKRIRVNLSTPSERNRPHTDGDGVTLLYYANLEWDLTWGGHTLFLDDNADDVDTVIGFKPGRIAIFDGSIPHMLITPSPLCPTYRMSFALQFGKKNA